MRGAQAKLEQAGKKVADVDVSMEGMKVRARDTRVALEAFHLPPIYT